MSHPPLPGAHLRTRSLGIAIGVCFVAVLTCNAASSIEQRVEALLAQMTLEEKIGQMAQVDTAALKDKSDIQKFALGSVLSGGGSDPSDNSAESWLKMAQECQG